MEFLVYRSTALVTPGGPEARAILDSALRNNARDNLTGFLHREGDTFVQYLEGPHGALWRLFERLGRDRRHTDVTLIGRGLIATRLFGDWQMGYATDDVASFLDFLDESAGKSLLAEASLTEAVWFLRGVSQRVDLGMVR